MTKKILIQRIDQLKNELPLSENDRYLLINYVDIFENCPEERISHFIFLLHSYRINQKYHRAINPHLTKKPKEGLPKLKEQAKKYAKKLQNVLQSKGILTKKSSKLNDLLSDLIEDIDSYFLEYSYPSKQALRDFFKNDLFDGKKTLAKRLIDSLDY